MTSEEAQHIMNEIAKVKYDRNGFGEELCNAVDVADVRTILYKMLTKNKSSDKIKPGNV